MTAAVFLASLAAESFGTFETYLDGSSTIQPCVVAQRKNMRRAERRRLIVATGV